MEILFNKDDNGQKELKETLGFLDGDYTFANLLPDIKLNTPRLIELVGQSVYNKINSYYKGDTTPNGADLVNHKNALTYMQLYVASMAYLDFAPNSDLTHGNSGRTVSKEEHSSLPWDWQIDKDNSATAKRAFKALDLLFVLLDQSEWTEWTDSEAYKAANGLFLKSTKIFDAAFPINKSGQLYYRLLSFMDDFETDEITAILKADKVQSLKDADEPDEDEKILLKHIHKAIAYLTMAKAYKVFPVEMFPSGLLYNENTRMKSQARAEVMQYLESEGNKYLKKLEVDFAKQNETFEEINPMPGLESGKKYVNL